MILVYYFTIAIDMEVNSASHLFSALGQFYAVTTRYINRNFGLGAI